MAPRVAFDLSVLADDSAGVTAWGNVAVDFNWKRRSLSQHEKDRARRVAARHFSNQPSPAAATERIEGGKAAQNQSELGSLLQLEASESSAIAIATGTDDANALDSPDGRRLRSWSDDEEDADVVPGDAAERREKSEAANDSFRSSILKYTFCAMFIAAGTGYGYQAALKIFWVGQLVWLGLGFNGPIRGVFLARSVVAVLAVAPVVPWEFYPPVGGIAILCLFWIGLAFWIAYDELALEREKEWAFRFRWNPLKKGRSVVLTQCEERASSEAAPSNPKAVAAPANSVVLGTKHCRQRVSWGLKLSEGPLWIGFANENYDIRLPLHESPDAWCFDCSDMVIAYDKAIKSKGVFDNGKCEPGDIVWMTLDLRSHKITMYRDDCALIIGEPIPPVMYQKAAPAPASPGAVITVTDSTPPPAELKVYPAVMVPKGAAITLTWKAHDEIKSVHSSFCPGLFPNNKS